MIVAFTNLIRNATWAIERAPLRVSASRRRRLLLLVANLNSYKEYPKSVRVHWMSTRREPLPKISPNHSAMSLEGCYPMMMMSPQLAPLCYERRTFCACCNNRLSRTEQTEEEQATESGRWLACRRQSFYGREWELKSLKEMRKGEKESTLFKWIIHRRPPPPSIRLTIYAYSFYVDISVCFLDMYLIWLSGTCTGCSLVLC